jgi:DNA-binding NarL/FixJ family response regulator
MWLAYWAVRWLTRKGLTMEQIAEQLHISVKTVYRMRHAVVIDGRIVYSVR